MMKDLTFRFRSVTRSMLLLIFLIASFAASSFAQTISGTVTSDKGDALPNVTIQLKGTQKNALTDAAGAYRIDASGGTVLSFSSVGYTGTDVAIAGKSVIDVVLQTGTENLNEVIVVALGLRKESKKLGYSATTVNTDVLSTNRSSNVGNSLQGKVAGLNVSPPASGPGGSSKIRIRGQSSFGGNNSPLIIVNGIPFNNSSVSAGGSNGNGTGNPTGGSSDAGDGLQSINPDDIESMTVLKGGAAAALYGSRAKDGAIIITTKTGKGTTGIGIQINSNFHRDGLSVHFQNDHKQPSTGCCGW